LTSRPCFATLPPPDVVQKLVIDKPERLTMNRNIRIGCIGAVTLLSLGIVSGCSQSDSTETAASATSSTANPSTDAVVRAAADFLDAVLKGDTQRASARLTPQAMQRIIASGKQFAPPGLETAKFRIGQVRAPAKDQALVQCVLTDTSVADTPQNEEMCCLLRFVENDWRVSGIAYGTGPDQPWTLSDFETGQNMAIPRQAAMATTPGTDITSGRPSPPRTAQEQVPVSR
jgi:hypothetical protein